jgi:hypothetical protein
VDVGFEMFIHNLEEMADWEIDKELELEAIYIKQQLFDPNKPPRESGNFPTKGAHPLSETWMHQDDRNSVQHEFDKLYDSLFASTTPKKDLLLEQVGFLLKVPNHRSHNLPSKRKVTSSDSNS